jgi:hypothetical protein
MDRVDYEPNTQKKYNFTLTGASIMLPSTFTGQNLAFSNYLLFSTAGSYNDEELQAVFKPDLTQVENYIVKNIYLPPPSKGVTPDLVILELTSRTPNIPNGIKLSISDSTTTDDIQNTKTMVYGWSYDTHDNNLENEEPAGVLKQSPLAAAKFNVGGHEITSTNQVCGGDSGGPIFIKSGSNLRLLGINSYGSGDLIDGMCYPNLHAVNIASHATWINSVLQDTKHAKVSCRLGEKCCVGEEAGKASWCSVM